MPPTKSIDSAMDDMDDSLARAADYLDDKLQTAGDLDSLAALLANIHAQHGLLKQQVRPPPTAPARPD